MWVIRITSCYIIGEDLIWRGFNLAIFYNSPTLLLTLGHSFLARICESKGALIIYATPCMLVVVFCTCNGVDNKVSINKALPSKVHVYYYTV